ncbi:MAG: SIS domain-containing protein [Candidatus Altiarchaeota archaeon]|nr:SIS domain-containing protein [Candidatus Altiarchaeota archaeon]
MATHLGKDSTQMRKFILEQGKAVKTTLEDNREKVAALRFLEFNHIILTGCGDKFSIPLSCQYLYKAFGDKPLEVIHSRTMADYPPKALGPETLVIFLTQSGKTKDTMDAMELAIEKGCKLIAITNLQADPNNIGEGIWKIADHKGIVLATSTTMYPEKPTPSTQTFHSSMILLLMILSELAKQDISKEVERIALLIDELTINCEDKWKKEAKTFDKMLPAYFMGDGPRFGMAYKAAMIMTMEAVKEDSAAVMTEEFLHSSIETLEKANKRKQGLVLFMPPTYAPIREHAEKVAKLWGKKAKLLKIEPVKVSSDPVLDDLLSPITQMIAIEWLTYWVARFRGTDPGKTDMVKKVRSEGF